MSNLSKLTLIKQLQNEKVEYSLSLIQLVDSVETWQLIIHDTKEKFIFVDEFPGEHDARENCYAKVAELNAEKALKLLDEYLANHSTNAVVHILMERSRGSLGSENIRSIHNSTIGVAKAYKDCEHAFGAEYTYNIQTHEVED